MSDAISRGWFGLPLVSAQAGTQLFRRRVRNWIPAFAGMSGTSALVLALLGASAGPAAADFRLCNNTGSRVGAAVGYKDADGWTTEGWWNLPSRSCETVLKGNLVARYYYVYAIDYDHGGEWMGQAFMCTRDKEFTIRGISDCLARGYDRTGFFEVDTGEQRAWTVQLTESSEQAPQRPLQSGQSAGTGAAAGSDRAGRRPLNTRRADGARKPEPMRRQRRTKVVATLGPASSSRTIIGRLFAAGADVFRINMSHTSHDKMRELVATIRTVEAECERPIGILVDLQGPKLRLGAFKNDWAEIDAGQDFVLDTDPAPGDATRINLPHPEIFAAIKPGDALLIDDGKLRLVATETQPAAHRRPRQGRRQDIQPQRREPARYRRAGRGAWRRRISPISKRRSMPASIGWRCRSSSGRRTSPRPRRSRAGAPR